MTEADRGKYQQQVSKVSLLVTVFEGKKREMPVISKEKTRMLIIASLINLIYFH